MADSLLLKTLREQLEAAVHYDETIRDHMTGGEPVHVRHTGQAISSAYELLRNAADYADDHLILQRAIKRYFKRTLFIVKWKPEETGQDLLGELIISGYLPDGRYGTGAAAEISRLAVESLKIYEQLRHARISSAKARDWVLANLSVKVRDLLVPHTQDLAVASFAYSYFNQFLPRQQLLRSHDEEALYDDALYTAIHESLLKSDQDVVRADLLRIHEQSGSQINQYILWNTHADTLYASNLTLRLKRIIQKNGAPFHILRALSTNNETLPETLENSEQCAEAVSNQIRIEYQRTSKRLNSGIIKSVAFLFLTKVVIGAGIEIPFDKIVFGHIIFLPLAINLLFPPLYMSSIWLGLKVPSGDNAQAIEDFINRLLYSDEPPAPSLPKRTTPYPLYSRIVFLLLALVPFCITILILKRLSFNPLQMVIFFVFFSTASYLGFRLSDLTRELRMKSQEVGFLALIRDLFYIPFILVGQWLSSKYSKINIVGEFLDLVIELPLKTLLSILRHSIRFLNEKHQELY